MEAALGRIEIVYPGPRHHPYLRRTPRRLPTGRPRSEPARARRRPVDRCHRHPTRIPLVSNDHVFDNTPGLAVETART